MQSRKKKMLQKKDLQHFSKYFLPASAPRQEEDFSNLKHPVQTPP